MQQCPLSKPSLSDVIAFIHSFASLIAFGFSHSKSHINRLQELPQCLGGNIHGTSIPFAERRAVL